MTRILTKNKNQSEFVNLIKSFNGKYHTWEIFSDFVTMYACAISNAVDKVHAKKREEMYLRIIRKYNKEEQNIFPKMIFHIVDGMEGNKDCDFLGELYMALELGNHWKGQFFTPYNVCRAMAELTGGVDIGQIKNDGYVAVNDTACGAGALLIAYANAAEVKLRDSGYNWQNHVLFTAQDVDMITGLMCYIQLSLIGCAGYVKIGDSLTDPMTTSEASNELLKAESNYWYTPMFFSDVWQYRWFFRALDKINTIPKKEINKTVIKEKTDISTESSQKLIPNCEFTEEDNGQLSLF